MTEAETLLQALEQATPESKSKAILTLQKALERQQKLVNAVAYYIEMRPYWTPSEIEPQIKLIERELKTLGKTLG